MKKLLFRSRWWGAPLLAVLMLVAIPAALWAHPLGNFTINRYSRLTLEEGELAVDYIVDMAEIPTFQARTEIDADGNGEISEAEQAAYLAKQEQELRSGLQLSIDGARLALAPVTREISFPPGQGGLPTMRLSFRFAAALPAVRQSQSAEFVDANFPGRLGWREMVVQSGQGWSLLDSTVPSQDLSDGLRTYPTDLLRNPPDQASAVFHFAPAGISDSGKATTNSAISSSPSLLSLVSSADKRLTDLISAPTLTPGFVLVALLLAFALGGAHALTPGHGKTVVAAYLVGSRGSFRHALFLGLTTTITHTAGVFALGLITLFASRYILPETLFPWLSLMSGLMVVAIGLTLFRGRLRGLLGMENRHSSGRHHHDDGHSHDHGHDHDHDHHHDHDHGHSHGHVPPGADGDAIAWRGLLTLGISGGLLPCPSALIVLLAAIALGRVVFGIVLIIVFSLGLAGVLTGIGLLMLHAKNLFARAPMRVSGRLRLALPVLSALFVTLAGAGVTWRALAQVGLF